MNGEIQRRKPERGFTIIEVIVAIMIFAVSIVSIFGAQFAAIATTDFARYTTQAIELARCRMNEIELEILTQNGFEEADVNSSGECCEFIEGEEDIKDFKCSWEIKAVELPDLSQALSGGGPDGGGGFLGDLGLGESGGGEDAFGMMGMVSSFIPMISDILRQAIRRVTVTVTWEQGQKKREFVLSQYLTHPTQGPLDLMQQAADVQQSFEAAEEGRGFMPIPTPGGGIEPR